MNIPNHFGDTLAISLSALCSIHCLATPVLLTLVPSLTGLVLLDEGFHRWLVLAVVPCSILSLGLGCRKHQSISVLLYGIIGIVLMLTLLVFDHEVLGETMERAVSLLASLFIAGAHWQNYRLCQQYDCSCD
ncbi:MerC domain-containing protein [Pseudoteredinibacter isoporae]|uniref:MerC domain-containing protein n=1 Tax=Pseudoteredinibacter isoporae TaxID=570281 RepID=UPI00310A3568